MHPPFTTNSRLQPFPTALSTALLFLALHCSALAASEPPALVLTTASYPPYFTDSGDGLLNIVIGEAFRRAGLRFTIVRLSGERGLKNANEGIEDGELARIGGMEKMYPNLIPVPGKIVDAHFVAFTRNAELKNITWDRLTSLSVGHLRGWKIFERNIQPGTQVTVVDTPEQLLSILDKNRIDVALYERSAGLALVKKMGIQDLHVVDPAFFDLPLFIYLNKKHADKVPRIASALHDLKAEGFYERACLKIFTPLAIPTDQCMTK